MSTEPAVALWRCTRDNSIVSGRPYCEGQLVRTWDLPSDFVTLTPVNATAKIIAGYNRRVFSHPLKPKSAMTTRGAFLPAVLLFGNSSTGCLVEGGEHDDMPRFEHSGTVLTWPGAYIVKNDRPANEAGALLLNYWLENKHRRAELDNHSCWNALTDELWLPPLSTRERPEETQPAFFGAPRPGAYVPLDARADAAMVPAAAPSSPIIRTRKIAETHAVQRGELDPTGRR
jgi:hypothetical protein